VRLCGGSVYIKTKHVGFWLCMDDCVCVFKLEVSVFR